MNNFSLIGLPGGFELLLFVPVLLCLVLTIWALIDILRSNFRGNDKIIWVLVVLFLQFFGAILYFLIGRRQKLHWYSEY